MPPKRVKELLGEARQHEAIRQLLARPEPPWKSIPSREVAPILGVSLQVLANWRVRGNGPAAEPQQPGLGNRTYYRPDEILSWLHDREREPWQFSRDWLIDRGLAIEPATKASTEWLAATAERLF